MQTASSKPYSGAQSPVDVDTTIVTPADRVRLPSIIAGLLTTLATLVVLTVLGLAVGLSRYDGTGNVFDLGAGVWGAISALIAFGLGGFVAARSAATASGPRNGIFNGAVMWMAAVVLIIMLIGGSIGSLLGLAGTAVTAASNVAGPVAGQAAAGATQAEGVAATNAVTSAIQSAQAALTPANRDQIAQDASQTAWNVLLTLGLSAAAALIGGALGSAKDRREADERRAAVEANR